MIIDLTCRVCNGEFKNIRSLIGHVRVNHGMEAKEYYDRYYKTATDGVCETCGKPTKFFRISQGGYFRFCSKACSNKSPITQARKVETNLEKYGTRASSQNSAVKEKARLTCLERYGTVSSAQSDTVKETVRKNSLEKYGTDSVNRLEWKIRKTKDSNLAKYGVESNFQLESNKEKSKQTCLARYGVDIASKCSEVKNKAVETNRRRYGTDWVQQNDTVKEKAKAAFNDRYGVDNPMQNREIYERQRQTMNERYSVNTPIENQEIRARQLNTMRERYGVEYPMQNIEIREQVKEKIIEKFRKLYKEKYPNVVDYNYDTITCHCDKCGKDYTITKSLFLNRIRQNVEPCTNCVPVNAPVSTGEKELAAYIASIYDGDIIENDRTVLHGKELDIYLPGKGLAFEFDGVFWHNELNKADNYHLEKTVACENANVHLVHIFEDEWRYRQDIVKSVISGMLGLNRKIYARKCEMREVGAEEARVFLEGNHLQGPVNSKYRYGLYHDGELVSLMTFGRSRFGKEFELHRFCNRINTNVVGGASRLFGKFVADHPEITKIVSFSERRLFSGSLYGKLGFSFCSYTAPSYYYVVDGVRHNRMEFQKHKLVKEGFDRSLTEHEIMMSRDIYRIYDCGNARYVWERPL